MDESRGPESADEELPLQPDGTLPPAEPDRAGEPRQTGGGRHRPLLAAAFRGLVVLLGAFMLACLPLVGVLRWVDPPASAFMLRHAANVRRLGQTLPYYQHAWLPWEQIPATVKLAAIAGEDQRFPSHWGFDLTEIRHAWDDYRQGGRLRGASTITQQTAKNLFLWPGSGWGRKAVEAWLALLMEILWPKERILEVYLNIAQFSPSTYGIEAASQRYFGQPASELSLEESALLIGVLPAPGAYRLDCPSARLRRRADWILDQSRRLGGTRYLDRL